MVMCSRAFDSIGGIIVDGGRLGSETGERTGAHVCVICLKPVDGAEYHNNDHAHQTCAEAAEAPSRFAGGHPSGFSPIDDAAVRAEIADRGAR